MSYTKIIGTGSYLPERRVSNADLAKFVDTDDEWIVSRTGIKYRHYAAENELTSDLALQASIRALAAAGVAAADVDLVIVATSTPDMIFPSTACILQAKLGAKNGAAFDVQAVCAGFVYALSIADKFIKTGAAKCALVVGAEVFSRIIDFKDRTTCVLFGDGAGAVVLKAADSPGILSTHLHADGSYKDVLCTPGSIANGAITGSPFLQMDGGTVYKFAVRAFEEVANEALAANQLTPADIDFFICHQANQRIIAHAAKKLALADEKVILTVGHHGNTSAASVPLALDETVRAGRVKSGDKLLLAALGGGFAWGAAMLVW